MGRVIEPRKPSCGSAPGSPLRETPDAVSECGRPRLSCVSGCAKGAARQDHRGQWNTARLHGDVPGTWEIPYVLFEPVGHRRRPGPCARLVMRAGTRSRRGYKQRAHQEEVPPSEGDRRTRSKPVTASMAGRVWEVGSPCSTDESGEPNQGTPWREAGDMFWNRWRER